jgi:hypothetical protein
MKMEAKVQNMIWVTDELDFFTLIEKKLEKQGFEVLETLPPDELSSKGTSGGGSRWILAERTSTPFSF